MGREINLQERYDQEVAVRKALQKEVAELRAQLGEHSGSDTSRLWDAFSVLPDAYAIFDAHEHVVIANQAYKDLFAGLEPMIEAGCTHTDLGYAAIEAGILNTDGACAKDWMAVSNDPKFSEGDEKFFMRTKDGRTFSVTSTRVANGDRVSYRTDITDEVAQRHELRQARADALAANTAKSAFLASMSHEVRTPMNGVIGMADLLCETTLDDEQRLYADTIRNSGESLLVIINDILDFSKIEAGQMELFAEPFNLEKAAHDVCMLLRGKAREKDIDMLLDYDMFLPVWFDGDAGRIRQVLLNLMSNALKFTKTGHVCLHVVGVAADDDRYELHIAVEDTGIGIPKDKLTHVFKEFAQIDQDENRKFEGTGLGLAISKRLIEQMGGEIWVDSTENIGSTFGFKIPLPMIKDEVTSLPRIPENISQVIVVDDMVENRTILLKQLGSLGLDVSTYSNATDALAAYDGGQIFDMVITDHLMPNVSGLEFGKELRMRGFEGRIVLLSSGEKLPTPQTDAPSTFDSILQKPMLRADLYRSLKLVFDPEPMAQNGGRRVLAAAETKTLKLLLAEDNKTNQLVFQKMLRSVSCDLRVAQDGLELVKLYQQDPADIVFTDISMPIMNGIEATQEIRAYEQNTGMKPVPIIALTAHAMQGDKERFMMAGMDDYLSKPLKKQSVLDMIQMYQDHITHDL